MITDYTPIEMLEMGVFGGNYFEKDIEFLGYTPGLRQLAQANAKKYSASHNAYKVKAGQNYEAWLASGWIFEEDPLGWFQWYCRYWSGRRHERDAHQIKRHTSYKSRFLNRVRNEIARGKEPSAVMKQGLLQWGIDWTK